MLKNLVIERGPTVFPSEIEFTVYLLCAFESTSSSFKPFEVFFFLSGLRSWFPGSTATELRQKYLRHRHYVSHISFFSLKPHSSIIYLHFQGIC